jgi:hypothetical protein
VINLGRDVPRERIVPFLTAKHSLEYCVSYAERADQQGFPALVVLGGDKLPAEGLARDFAAGATAEDVCARTIRALTDAGARHFHNSNLPVGRAQSVLSTILGKVGVTA